MIETNESLLQRVKSMDAHEAWREFFQHYWQVIRRYARKLGLKTHQADEVLQETMIDLMRILPEFDYDRRKGRFRNFLLTIVHRKSLAVLRRTRREASIGRPFADAAADTGLDQVAKEAEERWRESIRDTLLARLSQECDQETFAIYRAYVLEGCPANEVARLHGVKVNAVYQIKNRITQRLQKGTEAWLRDSELG